MGQAAVLDANDSMVLRVDGTVISHKTRDGRCAGSGEQPGEDVPFGSWLGLCPGLTPHGLRHGHQTWMDDAHVKYVLQAERMGHEVSGMRGTYGHITTGMRANLVAALQGLWETSLAERARLAAGSPVTVLDALLADRKGRKPRSAPTSLP
jgi:hypothetical protein